MLDLHDLPSSLFRDATVIGCYAGTCSIREVNGTGDERSIYIPLSLAATATTVSQRSGGSIEIRVDVAGRRVFTASARERLPVWTKESRCPDCKQGKIWAEVERDGSIRIPVPVLNRRFSTEPLPTVTGRRNSIAA